MLCRVITSYSPLLTPTHVHTHTTFHARTHPLYTLSNTHTPLHIHIAMHTYTHTPLYTLVTHTTHRHLTHTQHCTLSHTHTYTHVYSTYTSTVHSDTHTRTSTFLATRRYLKRKRKVTAQYPLHPTGTLWVPLIMTLTDTGMVSDQHTRNKHTRNSCVPLSHLEHQQIHFWHGTHPRDTNLEVAVFLRTRG